MMIKKIAFYLDNTACSSIDFSQPAKGNPGVGAAEYLHVALPFFMHEYSSPEYEFHIFAQHISKLPQEINSHAIIDIVDAAEKAKAIGVTVFVFRPRINEEKEILDVLDKLSLPAIGRAALTPSPKHIRRMAECNSFMALVCVGKEQYDSLIDSPIHDKIMHINNGVHCSEFNNENQVEKDENLVTYMGALVPQKGFHLLAKAWPIVLNQHPNAKLSVIGSAKIYNENEKLGRFGVAKEEYEKQCIVPYLTDNEGNLLSSVTFHGQLGKEKYSLLNKSIVGVANPSGQTETCCVSAVEISACSTAVVSGAYYALLDTVQHNKTGLLGKTVYDLADNICTLLDHPEMAVSMGVAGKKYARSEFDFSIVVPCWKRLFDTLENPQSLSESISYRNKFRHRKLLRIINRPIQMKIGKSCRWPSVQEVEHYAFWCKRLLRGIFQ